MEDVPTITIPLAQYESLKADGLELQALDDAGVDNWVGYSDAMELLETYKLEH